VFISNNILHANNLLVEHSSRNVYAENVAKKSQYYCITVKSVNGELIEVQYPPAAFSVAVVT